MPATLYAFDISNPGMSARLMLDRKGIDYRYRKLLPGIHPQLVRALGFSGSTVPALKIHGKKVQGSREIARHLEQTVPDPPLFPSDPAQRAAVEEAERWGDEYLQDVPRFILRLGGFRDHRLRKAVARAEGIPLPGFNARIGKASAWDLGRRSGVTEANTREKIDALPETIEKIDGFIDDGVIGGAEPNAADFQIAGSVRLLLAIEGVNRAIDGSRIAEHARRLLPDPLPGEPLPWVLPSEWLSPIAART
jgi:glutathione S-transferase